MGLEQFLNKPVSRRTVVKGMVGSAGLAAAETIARAIGIDLTPVASAAPEHGETPRFPIASANQLPKGQFSLIDGESWFRAVNPSLPEVNISSKGTGNLVLEGITKDGFTGLDFDFVAKYFDQVKGQTGVAYGIKGGTSKGQLIIQAMDDKILAVKELNEQGEAAILVSQPKDAQVKIRFQSTGNAEINQFGYDQAVLEQNGVVTVDVASLDAKPAVQPPASEAKPEIKPPAPEVKEEVQPPAPEQPNFEALQPTPVLTTNEAQDGQRFHVKSDNGQVWNAAYDLALYRRENMAFASPSVGDLRVFNRGNVDYEFTIFMKSANYAELRGGQDAVAVWGHVGPNDRVVAVDPNTGADLTFEINGEKFTRAAFADSVGNFAIVLGEYPFAARFRVKNQFATSHSDHSLGFGSALNKDIEGKSSVLDVRSYIPRPQ